MKRTGPLAPASPDSLERFLASPERNEGTLSLDEAHGFLFAMACSPETIPFPEMLDGIFGEEGANFASEAEAEAMLSALVELHNGVNAAATARRPRLLPGRGLRDDPLANFEPDAPVHRWCRGFVHGHDWLMDLWSQWLIDEMEEEMGFCMMALSFFASRDAAEAMHREFGRADWSFEAFAGGIAESFLDSMASYANMGRTIHEARMTLGAGETSEAAGPRGAPWARSGSPKVGRNDPCPCGSGKKFKRCCGG